MHALTGKRKRKGLGPIDVGSIIILLFASSAWGDQDHKDMTITTSMVLTQTITTHLGARPTQPANHAGYSLQGCYRRPDGDGDVGLEVGMPLSNADANGLTTSKCLEACLKASLGRGRVDSYSFAAVGEGRECYCATKLSPQAISVGPNNCSTPCVGDKNIACGGLDHISVYSLVDSAAAARYATQGVGIGDPGNSDSLPGGGKKGAQAVAVAMGSLAGCATVGLLIYLGCKLYKSRGNLSPGLNRSRMDNGRDKREHQRKDDDVVVISAPEPKETWSGPQRPLPPLPPLSGLGNQSGQHTRRRDEIMRVQFVHSPHPRDNNGVIGGSTAYQQPPAMPPASPLSPADDGLRQRRRSSSKPVDWARFDAVIPNGQFSPANSPTKDRFPNERPRRASITVYGNNHHVGGSLMMKYLSSSSESIGTSPAMYPSNSRIDVNGNGDVGPVQPYYRPDNIRVSAWSASTAEPSPNSITTVGSSILDVSPSSSTSRLNPIHMAAPAPAATGGLGNRAWSRRRLSTPFPPPGGSPTSSHSSGSRRSSLADIVGDYHGVRVGRVEQLREKEEQRDSRSDLMPSPLRVVKWKKSFADMKRAAGGAQKGDGDVNEDASPVLPVWDIVHTTPQAEELSPRESSKGRFEDEMPASPFSSDRTKGLEKEEDKFRGPAKTGQYGVKTAPVVEELLVLPATTYDGGRVLAAAKEKKMV